MFDLILYAIPFFVISLAVEWLSFRHTGDHDTDLAPTLIGYDAADTATSLSMGLGNVVINIGWKIVVAAIYVGVYELTPLRIPSDAWWAWVLLFVGDDLAYYWFHRVSHEVRVFWASHVVHHSSEHYNLSTALRQTWVPMTAFPFWIPLALIGMPPWMIILQQAISLTYQFFIHTERVGTLPRPIEFVLNTPSHHRAHHGANQIYLDRNYGGIMIIWDRLFGTFQPETERVRYGLTKNIQTHNPLAVATHEYAAIARDVRHAAGLREALGYTLRGPGWQPVTPPAEAGATTI
ncbi:MAG: sterol desaturase family protein [Solirubrobacteraceae bacterium]|jgi:sterol desaturase/sphingolipid hydroxylase (fatty acid hydroxylase superfamily)